MAPSFGMRAGISGAAWLSCCVPRRRRHGHAILADRHDEFGEDTIDTRLGWALPSLPQAQHESRLCLDPR